MIVVPDKLGCRWWLARGEVLGLWKGFVGI